MHAVSRQWRFHPTPAAQKLVGELVQHQQWALLQRAAAVRCSVLQRS